MNTPYSGNTKPYILALYSGEDKARVMPVLEELDKRGWAMCGQDGRASVGKAKRALTVLVFFSWCLSP